MTQKRCNVEVAFGRILDHTVCNAIVQVAVLHSRGTGEVQYILKKKCPRSACVKTVPQEGEDKVGVPIARAACDNAVEDLGMILG